MHHEDYVGPVVPGMSAYSPTEAQRDRILDDDEIRKLWDATSTLSPYASLLRLLLLTAQREAKIADMQWSDIDDEGVWTVRSDGYREKGNIEQVQLPPVALSIIRQQPKYRSNPNVFVGRGNGPFKSWSRKKREIDQQLQFAKPWLLHDLRRTARSLMSRAGVNRDHAERVLGHKQQGVEAVYDRHSYLNEKGEALVQLEAMVLEIVAPKTVGIKRRR
jgi:integrase